MKLISVLISLAALLVIASPSSASTPINQLERRGCCSHHHGVCGCSSGHATCCDGATSPSCGC